MNLLNKNIAEALDEMDISDVNRDILKALLYKEHLNRGINKDKEAGLIVSDILRKYKINKGQEGNDAIEGDGR